MNYLDSSVFDDPFAEDPISSVVIQTPKVNESQPADPELVERAVFLFTEERWTYKAASDTEAIFFVESPDREQTRIVFIAVKCSDSFCTCSDFAVTKVCVHLLAIQYELDFLARIEAHEQMLDDAEHPIYGCDPFMHYDRAGNPDN